MHEVSLAMSMIACLDELAREQGVKYIEKVTVQIGGLSNVMPEALKFAFESLVEGGEMEAVSPKGCLLVIERISARGRCRKCQKVSEISHESKQCVYCRSYDLEMISGYELQISEVEGEDEDAEGSD